jgi:hypothetical protein
MNAQRDRSSEVRPDRFWVVTAAVPLLLYALLGMLFVLWGTAR